MLHCGRGIFGSDFGTTTFTIRNNYLKNYIGVYHRLYEEQGAVDDIETKRMWFFEGKGRYLSKQDLFASIPNQPFAYWAIVYICYPNIFGC